MAVICGAWSYMAYIVQLAVPLCGGATLTPLRKHLPRRQLSRCQVPKVGGRAVSVLQWRKSQSRMLDAKWSTMRTSVATIRSYIAPNYTIYPWWSINRISQLGFVVTYYWNIFMKTSMMARSNIGQQHPLKWSTGRRILQSRMTTTHQGMVMTSQFTHFLLADTSGKVTN